MKWLTGTPSYAYDFEGREWCQVVKWRRTLWRGRVVFQEHSKNWFLTGRRMSSGMAYIVHYPGNPGGIPSGW